MKEWKSTTHQISNFNIWENSTYVIYRRLHTSSFSNHDGTYHDLEHGHYNKSWFIVLEDREDFSIVFKVPQGPRPIANLMSIQSYSSFLKEKNWDLGYYSKNLDMNLLGAASPPISLCIAFLSVRTFAISSMALILSDFTSIPLFKNFKSAHIVLP